MGIHTAIDIAAPAETVWRILMDFDGAHACKHGCVDQRSKRARCAGFSALR